VATPSRRRANSEEPRDRSEAADEGASQVYPRGELIVIAHADAQVKATADGVPIAAAADVRSLASAFSSSIVNLRPLFRLPGHRLARESTPYAADILRGPDLSLFYRVEAPPEQLPDLADRIRESEAFETAYIKPFTELPIVLNEMAPAAAEPPSTTADFSPRQGYLSAAPGGVDAAFAWSISGGGGRGVEIIDIEGGWDFSHEDLIQLAGVVGGVPQTGMDWRNHGTAVLGILGGGRNGFGVTGISPEATIAAISHSGPGQSSSTAIRQAADKLQAGDIILLEAHRPGPESGPGGFQTNPAQQGYIAIEWWPDDFAAIQYATGKGIIVVGAAGNGAVNLDAAIYDTNPAPPNGPFPSWWRNPFRRNPQDSGAVLVGAGAPPSGAFGPDRSRLDFSNYGSPVDAQGWGREVVSTGYGDLQGGSFEDLWYTAQFSGTSSASPIVVGTLACAQGAWKAASAGNSPLTPAQARNLLRTTGSPQVGTQRIGDRPDLRQILAALEITVTPEADGTQGGPPRGISILARLASLEARLAKVERIVG
jgi:hypothetical protein